MKQPTPIDLVIFDCDGVLIDSEIISAQVLIALLADHGIAIDMDFVRDRFLGRSFPSVAATLRETFAQPLPEDFERTYRTELLEAFARDLKPTDGLQAVLEQLDVRVCVATSSSPERAHRSLEIAGLLPRFAGHIYTASEVANGKPAPDLFLHAAAREGVPAERCLVIEDSLPGVAAAEAACMAVVRYAGGSHLDPANISPIAEVEALSSWAAFAAHWRALQPQPGDEE
ncbi:MAG: HAD family hydrolase [Pseudomonadota bacterium]